MGGGYRIRPGYRLPPLMLTNEEAVVVSLGLLVARRLGLDSEHDAAESALSKLHRVLPTTLRRQVESLERSLGFTAPPLAGMPAQSEAVLELADAIGRHRRVRLAYRSHEGVASQRRVSPYGLVVHRGRWYLAAHDHGRGELRTFRVDRIDQIDLADGALHAPPADFDAVAYVSSSLARVPWAWGSRCCSSCPSTTPGRVFPRRLPSSFPLERERCFGCASARSTGWPPSSPGSTVTSQFTNPASSAEACERLRVDFARVSRESRRRDLQPYTRLMEIACASCGAQQPVDANFCTSCGAALRRLCPACGAEQVSSALFCSACGTRLQEEVRRASRHRWTTGATRRHRPLRRSRRVDRTRRAPRP